jgi:hypothetical protein
MAASASVSFIAPTITHFNGPEFTAPSCKGNFRIVERNGAIGENLLLLVALAGDQHNVAGRGACSANRMAAADPARSSIL